MILLMAGIPTNAVEVRRGSFGTTPRHIARLSTHDYGSLGVSLVRDQLWGNDRFCQGDDHDFKSQGSI